MDRVESKGQPGQPSTGKGHQPVPVASPPSQTPAQREEEEEDDDLDQNCEVCQHADYDVDVALQDREGKWGFTLAELQAATKVVRTLFHNPALFIGDPYLSDSRLYTMITRDRKTKRENREVYKTIMNEEKSRRKKFQRMQDIEAVRKTAMKREREEALNALLLEGGPTASSPPLLLLRDRDPSASGAGQGGALPTASPASPTGGDEEQEAMVSSPVSAWASTDKELLRLIGAFENLLRLEKAYRGAFVPPAPSSPSTEAEKAAKAGGGGEFAKDTSKKDSSASSGNLTGPAPPVFVMTPEEEQREARKAMKREKAARFEKGGKAATEKASPRKPSDLTASLSQGENGASGTSNPPNDAPLPPEVDWTVVTQLTAQVYRYIPHIYGSQMPPPLFPGPVPADAPHESHRNYIIGAKVLIARRAMELVHLQPSANKKTVRSTRAKHEGSAPQFGKDGHVGDDGEEKPSGTSGGFPGILHETDDDVVVRSPVPALADIAALRRWVGGGEDGDSHRPHFQRSESEVEDGAAVVVETSHGDVLRGAELLLLEGGTDERFEPATAKGTEEDTEPSAAAPFTPYEVAEQTLNLFIARRLYQSRPLRSCGESPVVVERAPPTSESEEPDTVCPFDDVQLYSVEHHEDDEELKLSKWISCHTCKVRYNRLHPYYYSMCHLCGEFNYNKRLMGRDLRGKVVLLTGCRIKIGYAMAISLLRCGATVLGTTRFAHEAVARFQQEQDYDQWKDRLHLFSLDLRDMWVVTQFCAFVRKTYPKLFAIINNAAQTIARTPQYTEHLRHVEVNPPLALREAIAADAAAEEWHHFFLQHTSVTVGKALSIEYHPHEPFLPVPAGEDPEGGEEEGEEKPGTATGKPLHAVTLRTPHTHREEEESEKPSGLIDHVVVAGGGAGSGPHTLIFDRYDTQSEESDHRDKNSWVMKLAEVQGSEAAEVMAINALSPFIMNSKLKSCLTNRDGDARPDEPRFIINVSAMEGQFYRFKQTTHPHTNMAKAALNMMTRTSGEDYAQDGIYMNSVDTGWITDESPKLKKERRAEQFMLCPLDEVDAAARCLDLIYTDSRAYGKFYKDFKEIAW